MKEVFMKGKTVAVIVCAIALFVGGLFLIWSCSSEGGAGYPSYGGTDPKGDFIVVMIDRENSKIMKINYTAGETESSQQWYPYTTVAPDTAYGSGFSIVNTVDLGGGAFVLFAEFQEAACVYQAFDEFGDANGNPVYLVYRDAADSSSFYSRAYNWVKFFIDSTGGGADSDMNCGFAAFDASGQSGRMYGASYSKRDDFINDLDHPDGLSNINETGDAGVDGLTYDAETMTNVIWNDGVGNWDGAIAVTGTASGALILDFGPSEGGGAGLAVPQTAAVDNLATFWPTVTGTYLTMVYGYSNAGGEEIGPVKVVIYSDGSIDVYDYNDSTVTGTSFFDEPLELTRVEDVPDGPVAEESISESFLYEAGNGSAASTVVQNAHLCKGAFIARYFTGGDYDFEQLIMMGFDPSGRFFGFTMFEWDEYYESLTIRFGLGIKDADYDDEKVPAAD
jgi:hypothetical protein